MRHRRRRGNKAKRSRKRQQRERKICDAVKSLKTELRRMRKSRETPNDARPTMSSVDRKDYYISKSIAVRRKIESCLCFISQKYSNI